MNATSLFQRWCQVNTVWERSNVRDRKEAYKGYVLAVAQAHWTALGPCSLRCALWMLLALASPESCLKWESQAPPQTYETRICILTRIPSDSYVLTDVWETLAALGNKCRTRLWVIPSNGCHWSSPDFRAINFQIVSCTDWAYSMAWKQGMQEVSNRDFQLTVSICVEVHPWNMGRVPTASTPTPLL